MRRIVRRLMQMAAWLYPAPWRERYGAEFEALLDDVKPAGRDVWDVMRGALIMQMTAWNFGKLMALCGLAGLFVAGAIAYAIPAAYVSTAVMRIAPGGQQDMTPEGTSPEAAHRQLQERLQRMQQEILSRRSLAAIIQRPALDLYHRERTRNPLEDVVQDMRNKIHIRPVGTLHATAFSIAYEYPDKFKAQAVVRELVNKFTEVSVMPQREKAQNLKAQSLELLDPASLPERPFYPNRASVLLVGLVTSMVAGLLFGLMAALRRRSRSALGG